MREGSGMVRLSVEHPKLVTAIMVVVTVALVAAATLPSVWPRVFPMLHAVKVDTDPENMLPAGEPVRVFHGGMKQALGLHDMVVVGVVNETDPEGVFNPESLSRIHALTRYAQTLRWPDPERPDREMGVVERDLIAPSTVDNIEQGTQPGEVKFEWLMRLPPLTRSDAAAVRDKARRIPFLEGTLVSEDGKAVCLYLPLTHKDLSYRVYSSLNRRLPMLWAWGPLSLELRKLEMSPQDEPVRQALLQQGEHAAFQSPDVSEFSRTLRQLVANRDLSPVTLTQLQAILDRGLSETPDYPGADRVYITGLPVAEDTFGVEMFQQMAISAPLAMLVIFLLMLLFFRKITLIISPMIVAMVAVLLTMGLLIVTGRTIHIMSSMIPIFIMPISVLDSVHILSEFFDKFQETRDRKRTILGVMKTLYVPMLYTSLTTAAGFASLALTPIPPVQVFGLYVAFGVMAAWVFTVTFIPAYVMFIPQRSLENFGLHKGDELKLTRTPMGRLLAFTGRISFGHAKLILGLAGLAVVVAGIGISRIHINDNPTRWFVKSHPIRVADDVLNRHFGGTYMAYLALEADPEEAVTPEYLEEIVRRLRERARVESERSPETAAALEELAEEIPDVEQALTWNEVNQVMTEWVTKRIKSAPEDEADTWERVGLLLETFKDPGALRYVANLQKHLAHTDVVGKSNSLSDIVKTVYRELVSGQEKDLRIPNSPEAVGQCLITYQSSHRPQDLGHFVTWDHRKTSIWVQLRSGDNRDMREVVETVADWKTVMNGDTVALTELAHRKPGTVKEILVTYEELANLEPLVEQAPERLASEVRSRMTGSLPLVPVKERWFGLTYINLVWQEKMVTGMLQSFMGSFLVVLLMMIVLFRSALWGLLSMIPLTLTVGLIYAAVGFMGKDYDMPVAVLSSLTLGLAVDYAIHFLSRTREVHAGAGSWQSTVPAMFGEPGRAIVRNVIVIGVGFLPLLAAPLVPYRTVGVFMAAILISAGAVSLLLLPALLTVLERWAFPRTRLCAVTCMCGTCVVASVAAVALVAINLRQFLNVGWTELSGISVSAVLIAAGTCFLLSRRRKCLEIASTEKGEGS